MGLICSINEEQLQDFINLAVGLFAPLDRFMTAADYYACRDEYRLENGSPWTIPVTLDVEPVVFRQCRPGQLLYLEHAGDRIGWISVEDCFQVDARADAPAFFKVADPQHPGVAQETRRYPCRIGGKVQLSRKELLKQALIPAVMQAQFKSRGWKSVVGFQTRNPIHRAHEYLQRIGMEICDGLLVNPLVGWRKTGDFSEEAVLASYRTMIAEYYPANKVHLAALRTPMRYAGPREAVFHAQIRKNLGCTHFISGRDHAGVNGYYDKYEAHDFARRMAARYELGIELLLLKGPFYCQRCDQIVTEESCGHAPEWRIEISGTKIRELIRDGNGEVKRYLRPEVCATLRNLKTALFVS